VAREFDAVRRVVGAGPGDHGHGDRLAHGSHEVRALTIGERRRFTGRSRQDQPVVSAIDRPSREPLRRIEVQPPLRIEGRDHGRHHPAEVAGRSHRDVR
jgi:hypothetical protein